LNKSAECHSAWVIVVFVYMFSLGHCEFHCHCQRSWLPWKTHLRSNLLCVECSLT